MTQNNNILQELKELGSSLANAAPQNAYTVPDGYFDGLVNQVLNRIKALEAENVQEELGYLSPALNSISKQMPYSIPAGYFEGLENRLMEHVRESGDYLQKESLTESLTFGHTAKEELEALSPMLSGLKKQMPYQVPQGYFENLNEDINSKLNNKTETKVVSISSRKWFRYAVAAMIVGVIVLGGLLFWNQKPVDPAKNPDEWVAKNIKKVNAVQLDDFIKLADQESTTKGSVANMNEKPDEIKELMKDVPDNQIQELLNETAALDEPGDNTSLN